MSGGRVTSRRNNNLLAGEDAVGVGDGGIGSGKAVPRGGMPEFGFSEPPERFAFADLDTCCGGVGSGGAGPGRVYDGSGEIQLSAGANVVGIDDEWIGGQKFAPAIAAAEILLGQLPERVACLDADGALRSYRGEF